jgi:hypothetical protein
MIAVDLKSLVVDLGSLWGCCRRVRILSLLRSNNRQEVSKMEEEQIMRPER